MNNDLISRKALREVVKTLFWSEIYKSTILDIIDNAPTAVDVKGAELAYNNGYKHAKETYKRPVYCKDCKHTVLSENGETLICCLTMKVGTVRPNFYCGNGERR